MSEESVRSRLVVIWRNDERSVSPKLFRFASKFYRGTRIIRSRAGNNDCAMIYVFYYPSQNLSPFLTINRGILACRAEWHEHFNTAFELMIYEPPKRFEINRTIGIEGRNYRCPRTAKHLLHEKVLSAEC